MSPTDAALSALKTELRAIEDLEAAAAVLDWDQATQLPERAAEGRGRQMALLMTLAHERRVSDRLASMLDDAEGAVGDDLGRALVRRARREQQRARRLPAEFVAELRAHLSASYVAWAKAKPTGDFAAVAPLLERTVALSRRKAAYFSDVEHVADPMIDEMDPGMSVARLRALFEELRAELVPIVRAITARPTPDTSILRVRVDAKAQLALSTRIARELGYDFSRGRLDLSPHPFSTRVGDRDVRITTRVVEDDLANCLYSTIHEVGHALYELGVAPSLLGTPLGRGTSSGIHESQSRLFENLVGRSRPFSTWLVPILREHVPEAFGELDVDSYYRAVNRVSPSLIRTEADEVTYNLHVMLRCELAWSMLEGSLRVAELPEAWRARIRTDLGVEPATDREGVLQDVHWFSELIGGLFQGYTIGNLFAAQLWETVERALPSLESELAGGRFEGLVAYLGEHVHVHGAALDPDELIERTTGAPLGTRAFVTYLKRKYGALYGIAFDAPER